MFNLEQEFTKLVNGMYQQIQDKQSSGEISIEEANSLRDLVYLRVANVRGRERDSWCESGGEYYDYDDQTGGWSPSTC